MDSFRGIKHNCQKSCRNGGKDDNIISSDYIKIKIFYFNYAKKLAI